MDLHFIVYENETYLFNRHQIKGFRDLGAGDF